MEDQARDPRGSLGPEWVGKMQTAFLSDPLNLRGSIPVPIDPLAVSGPLQVWAAFPSPSRPSEVPVPSCLHFSSLFPPRYILPGHSGISPDPLGVVVPHQCLISALVVRRYELHILLLHHLDSAPDSSS